VCEKKSHLLFVVVSILLAVEAAGALIVAVAKFLEVFELLATLLSPSTGTAATRRVLLLL
jgi:hypothetical protein